MCIRDRFYQTFLQGLATGIVDYDNRQRNIRLETEIAFTIEQLTQIKTTLQHIAYNTPCLLYTSNLSAMVSQNQHKAKQAPAPPLPMLPICIPLILM